MEIRPASTSGTAAPAAKGITVRGTSAIETALLAVSYTIPSLRLNSSMDSCRTSQSSSGSYRGRGEVWEWALGR
jgi:hypothetical protein